MKKVDTYSYRGWLISDNFLKRSLAIFGHNLVGVILIYISLIVTILTVAGVVFVLKFLVESFLR